MVPTPSPAGFHGSAPAIQALGITRVSTAEQAEGDRYSIPHQRARITDFCRQRGWDLVGIVDYVQSGGSNKRELDQVLERVRRHRIQVVVVNELDRLARDMVTTLLFLEDLKRSGCRFASVTDDIDMTTPDGELKMMFLGIFAHYFRRQLSRKVKGGLLERARKGKHHGGRPPFGYTFNGDRLEPVPEEAAIVREIFESYVRDGLGARAICKELLGRGIPTKTGRGEWNAADLRRLLRRRVYAGDLVHGELEFQIDRSGRSHKIRHEDPLVVEGAYPALVDRETWEAAQRIMASRQQAAGRAVDSPYLLSGLVRCALCGRTMVPVHGRRTAGPRYVCRGYQQSGACTSRHAQPVTVVEDLVVRRWWQEVAEPSPETVSAVLEAWDSQDADAADGQRRQAQWERRLAALPGMRERAEDALLQGLFDANQYTQAVARLAHEEAQARAALTELLDRQRRRWNDPALVAKVLAAWKTAAAEFQAAGNVSTRRSILRRYVRLVEIGNDEVRITWGSADTARLGDHPHDPANSPTKAERRPKAAPAG